MFVLSSLRRLIVHVANVPYHVIMILVFLHIAISFTTLSLLNEGHLTDDIITFFYFWVVSSSTVGYGDLSPVTQGGRLFVSLMIPSALILFSMTLTKFGKSALHSFHMVQKGMVNLTNMNNHILIMGYQASRTEEIISIILSDDKREPRDIVVVCDTPIDNPFLNNPEIIFCKLDDMIKVENLAKCGLPQAHKIIVDSGDDNTNYVRSARYARMSPKTHITTSISNTTLADDLSDAHKNIDVIVDYSEELTVRAMQDRGTSRVFNELLDGRVGQNIYVTKILPIKGQCVRYMKESLASKHGASVFAIAKDEMGKTLQINPPQNLELNGARDLFVYYIHTRRLSEEEITSSF